MHQPLDLHGVLVRSRFRLLATHPQEFKDFGLERGGLGELGEGGGAGEAAGVAGEGGEVEEEGVEAVEGEAGRGLAPAFFVLGLIRDFGGGHGIALAAPPGTASGCPRGHWGTARETQGK